DRTVRVWEMGTGRPLWLAKDHNDDVTDVRFSPDGTRLATGSLDGTGKLWHTRSGKELQTLGGAAGVWAVAWSPDGRRLAVGCGEPGSALHVWDLASGHVAVTLQVAAVAWGRDGRRLAAGGHAGAVMIRDASPGYEPGPSANRQPIWQREMDAGGWAQ